MCLAVPGLVVSASPDGEGVLFGEVDFGGVSRRVCLEHVREARPGDYVLVHVGFALQRIDEGEARRVFEFLKEMDDLGEVGA